MAKPHPPLAFPVRGVPGGYVDFWQRDELAEEAALRAAAETAERRLMAAAKRIGRRWRAEIVEGRKRASRERKRRASG